MSSGSLFHASRRTCSVRKGALAELGAKSWYIGLVARSRSMRKIVGEDAVCWHSLSERLVLCLADFSELTTLWFVVHLK